ncbi:hypothetical protein AK812_SmicGene29707 [Symbiodinium microadriaticum]|uniref:Uncharacterized protein n=1 Tax=Symbiodinium microadriaticum TaxID=2951 RepID=A0A1Q9D158_SYMMI|nr:hypothetical protein AK812_SmicGene29707 [Symbiodinium microadriaticum]
MDVALLHYGAAADVKDDPREEDGDKPTGDKVQGVQKEVDGFNHEHWKQELKRVKDAMELDMGELQETLKKFAQRSGV